METFEESIGALLKCCFGCLEVLQTADVNHLIDYCSEVLENTMAVRYKPPQKKEEFGYRQEIVIFEYLKSICDNHEHLNDQVIGLRMFDKSK